MNRRRLGILTAAVVASLTILPMSGAAAAEPLAVGAYDLVLDGKALSISIGEDGTPSIEAEDGLIVLLSYDELGRVLDVVRVETPDGAYELDVDVARDGSYTQSVTAIGDDEVTDEDVLVDEDASEPVVEDNASEDELLDEDVDASDDDASDDEDEDELDTEELEERHGAIVSTVAHCSPRGRTAKDGGWPNHGTFVSAAANGLPLEVTVTDPTTGEPTTISADLSTLAGAEAMCAAIAEHQAAVAASDVEGDTKADAKAEKQAQKQAAKDAKKAAKDGSSDDADEQDEAESNEDESDDAKSSSKKSGKKSGKSDKASKKGAKSSDDD